MDKAKKNDWVEIENIVLIPDERAPQVPDDTKATPYDVIKGFLMDDEASIEMKFQ